ncbi:MAG: hypothetical protein QW751_00765 [Candidatus Aenigmatarchaeota archaeon]|nr:hypothetical protein [Candidatus Aenigmarchaeota archaeon]
MPEEEVELAQKGESYEIIPVTPIRKLEKRMEALESAGTIPQIQSLINQIMDLIRGNQRIVEEIVRANADLRNEISKLPPKIDDLTTTMKEFISMVKAAGEEEISAPSAEVMRPLQEALTKLTEQNQKLIEGNQAILESLEALGKKMRGGTPVSALMSSYPGLKLRREETTA